MAQLGGGQTEFRPPLAYFDEGKKTCWRVKGYWLKGEEKEYWLKDEGKDYWLKDGEKEYVEGTENWLKGEGIFLHDE